MEKKTEKKRKTKTKTNITKTRHLKKLQMITEVD